MVIKLKHTIPDSYVNSAGCIFTREKPGVYSIKESDAQSIISVIQEIDENKFTLIVSDVVDEDVALALIKLFPNVKFNFNLTPDVNQDEATLILKSDFYDIIQKYFCKNPGTNLYSFDYESLLAGHDFSDLCSYIEAVSEIYSE